MTARFGMTIFDELVDGVRQSEKLARAYAYTLLQNPKLSIAEKYLPLRKDVVDYYPKSAF